MIRNLLLAAAALGLSAGAAAAADARVAYDDAMAERFESKREIVDEIQAQWGRQIPFEQGSELSEATSDGIVPGQMMPEDAPREMVPASLGDLPRLAEESEWIRSGPHLIELAPDGSIVMVIYDALT